MHKCEQNARNSAAPPPPPAPSYIITYALAIRHSNEIWSGDFSVGTVALSLWDLGFGMSCADGEGWRDV